MKTNQIAEAFERTVEFQQALERIEAILGEAAEKFLELHQHRYSVEDLASLVEQMNKPCTHRDRDRVSLTGRTWCLLCRREVYVGTPRRTR